MNLIQSLLYGLISGISSFLPVSSYGHQVILKKLFGQVNSDPPAELFVHLAIAAAVFLCCRANLRAFFRQFSDSRHRRRSHGFHPDYRYTYELRLLITAAIAMLAVLLLRGIGQNTEGSLLLVCLFFVINGIVLYITDHLRQSNKDASHMTGLDAVLIGLLSGASIFPGISRVGVGMSLAVGRGADKSHAMNWALILSIPALMLLSVFDFVDIFSAVQLSITFMAVLGYFLAALSAFVGSYATILLMRFLVVSTGFTGFACYSWGMSMLTFILYLIA